VSIGRTSREPLQVVIAGAGVAALEAAMALRALAADRLRVELLTPELAFRERPLSVLAPFGGELPAMPLDELLGDAGIHVRMGRLEAVDAQARELHDTAGGVRSYDALLVATGARKMAIVTGALSFAGPESVESFRLLLSVLIARRDCRLAFVLPQLVSWPLPLYELALMTAAQVRGNGRSAVELVVVTPEASPLAMFGAEASEAVAAMLEARGIEVLCGRRPRAFAFGAVDLGPSEAPLPADAAVTLPVAAGQWIPGLPTDAGGFLPVDGHGRVAGTPGVWAAGDCTSFPLKQGGLAAQQAEAAAADIARVAGVPVAAEPFRPVLRGMLLAGDETRWMRAEPAAGWHEEISDEPLWWPPDKLAGRYLPARLALLRHGREPALRGALDVDLPIPMPEV
jgi:sulfide:quinone oxidoreductase